MSTAPSIQIVLNEPPDSTQMLVNHLVCAMPLGLVCVSGPMHVREDLAKSRTNIGEQPVRLRKKHHFPIAELRLTAQLCSY